MDLKTRINELIEEHRTMRQASYQIDVDVGYLHHLRKGTKDSPTNDVCAKLGLVRHIKYTKL